MFQMGVSPSNTFDPSLFLSTAAQSTAALVAIIGGFLISRLISTLAEKSQKIQSLGELKNKRRIKDAELGKFQKTVTTSTHKWFREENLASIIENMGNANFTKMVDEFKTIGSERQDIALYANELKSLVTRAYK